MTQETSPSNNGAFEKNRERGQEIRKAATERVANLFRRFGKDFIRGVDASVGATARGVELTGQTIDAGIGATVEGAMYVKDKAVETKDAVIETAVAGKEFVVEKVAQTKEAVVDAVNNTVEGTKNLIDSGVALTQETYTGAKNKILEAKQGVLSWIEARNIRKEKEREEAKIRETRVIIAQLKVGRKANLDAARVQLDEYERKSKVIENLEAILALSGK